MLGSNDAIVSTAGLMIGVAAAQASTQAQLVAGAAALVAGSMSMAVGEYVSVSSQHDAEDADIATEQRELQEDPEAELRELTAIYLKRGLDRELAVKVAQALTLDNPLQAHLRDELGIEPHSRARPLQAAVVSALSFALFALLPLLGLISPPAYRVQAIAAISLLALAGLGAAGARLGGAKIGPAALRVTAGGALAMGLTFAVGRWFGVALG